MAITIFYLANNYSIFYYVKVSKFVYEDVIMFNELKKYTNKLMCNNGYLCFKIRVDL